MQALIDAKPPPATAAPHDRRLQIAAITGFSRPTGRCTPAATVAIRRYIEEGSKISRDLTRVTPIRMDVGVTLAAHASRRSLRSLLSMRVVMLQQIRPHPEGAAKRPSRRIDGINAI